MIQRIQTLWLAFIVVVGIGTFYFPFASYTFPLNQNNTELREDCTYGMMPRTNTIYERVLKGPDATQSRPYYEWLLIIPNIVIAIIALVAIFLYKNRQVQVRVVAIGAILLIVYFAVIWFWKIDSLQGTIATFFRLKKDMVAVKYNTISMCLPILQLLLFILAERAIRRDNRLVSSSDRLR
jgi:hypothetical protein